MGGFHSATLLKSHPVFEPIGGIVTHHVQYREEVFTRFRMDRLCRDSGRNDLNDGIGNTEIQNRWRSLNAVYAHRWDEVENLRRVEPALGVHPTPWPDPTSTRRWYIPGDLEAARDAWTVGTGSRPSVLD
jgi:hypothetical protein